MSGRLCAGMAVAVSMAVSALAEVSISPALQTKTERVVVFKDGYCLFVKRATGSIDRAGRTYLTSVPKSMVLGSFWAIPKSGKLRAITARQWLVLKQGRQETEKCLALDFDLPAGQPPPPEADITVCHFGPGLRWIPTYRVDLTKADEADIQMQAEILNEAEDLTETALDLVVGVPNFRFRDVPSPLGLEAAIQNVLQQAAPQLMNQMMSNTLMTQRVAEFRSARESPETAPAGTVPALPSELAGEGAQDLFVYHVAATALRMGERAAIPLVSSKVPCLHLYTWEVRLSRSGIENAPGAGKQTSPVRLLKNEVWHQIELSNATAVPWTTGSVLVMNGFLPVCQELLTYTSAGGKCQVPLTVAVDVRGTYAEEETAREVNALQFDGHAYIRIGKRGKLEVTNYKKERIPLLVTCHFGGNVTAASDGGKMAVTDFQNEDWANFRGHPALSGHSQVTWRVDIDAGKTKELTCDYFYYTR